MVKESDLQLQQISLSINFKGSIERTRDGYIGICPDLNLSVKGETEEEAKKELIKQTKEYIETFPYGLISYLIFLLLGFCVLFIFIFFF